MGRHSDKYRQWKRKSKINEQIVFSLDQDKNDDDGQKYKDKIPDHKNLNDLDVNTVLNEAKAKLS